MSNCCNGAVNYPNNTNCSTPPIFPVAQVVQNIGESTTNVISQNTVSNELSYLKNYIESETEILLDKSTKNLFNLYDIIEDHYLDDNGYLIPLEGWFTSNYIDVSISEYYSLSKGGFVRYYDIARNDIGGQRIIDNNTLATIPAEAKLLRFSTISSQLNGIQVEAGNVVTDYEPYIQFKTSSIPIKSIIGSAVSSNLYFYGSSTLGKLLFNGVISDNPDYFISDYIVIEPNTKYTANFSVFYACYDKDYIMLSSGLVSSTNPLTSPNNSKYIRISSIIGEILNACMLHKGETAIPYQSYKLLDASIVGNVVSEYSEGFTKSRNLFNPKYIIPGYYLGPGTGALVPNSDYFVSEYIPIKPNTSYTGLVFYTFYDINFNIILSDVVTGGEVYATSTENTYYCRLSWQIASRYTAQLTEGIVEYPYNPFGILVEESHIVKTIEQSPTTTTVVVNINGTAGVDCDFTDLREAINSITDNSYTNRYVITIMNGVYDFSNDGYYHLPFKNYVDYVGQTKTGVRLIKRPPSFHHKYAVFDIDGYGEKIQYASVRNLTCICYNGKGPIHVDSTYNDLSSGGTIEVINCDLINENTPDIPHYNTGLACGLRDGQRVVAKYVNSNSSLWAHNVAPLTSYSGCAFELYSCRFPNTMVGDVYCYGRDKFIMHNCKLNFIIFDQSDPFNQKRDYFKYSWDIDLQNNEIGYIIGQLQGYPDQNNDFWTYVYGGKFGIQDSTIHNYCKNNTVSNLNKCLVTLDTNTYEMSVKEWTFGSKLYGIALDDIAPNDYGTIQYRGIFSLPGNASTPILFNDALELNSSGHVVKHTNGDIVGYALESLSSGVSYIKVKMQL